MSTATREQKHAEYLRHKDKYIARAKKWTANNPEKRKEIIKRDNDKSVGRKRIWHEIKMFGQQITRTDCENCGAIPDHKRGLVVHHIDGNNGKRGKTLNNSANNLMVLCRSCHASAHYKGEIQW